MNPFEMVVAIVLIVMIANVVKARAKFQAQARQPGDDGEARRAQEEVRALKERIQVLERVITENHGSTELDREIERLRDR